MIFRMGAPGLPVPVRVDAGDPPVLQLFNRGQRWNQDTETWDEDTTTWDDSGVPRLFS